MAAEQLPAACRATQQLLEVSARHHTGSQGELTASQIGMRQFLYSCQASPCHSNTKIPTQHSETSNFPKTAVTPSQHPAQRHVRSRNLLKDEDKLLAQIHALLLLRLQQGEGGGEEPLCRLRIPQAATQPHAKLSLPSRSDASPRIEPRAGRREGRRKGKFPVPQARGRAARRAPLPPASRPLPAGAHHVVHVEDHQLVRHRRRPAGAPSPLAAPVGRRGSGRRRGGGHPRGPLPPRPACCCGAGGGGGHHGAAAAEERGPARGRSAQPAAGGGGREAGSGPRPDGGSGKRRGERKQRLPGGLGTAGARQAGSPSDGRKMEPLEPAPTFRQERDGGDYSSRRAARLPACPAPPASRRSAVPRRRGAPCRERLRRDGLCRCVAIGAVWAARTAGGNGSRCLPSCRPVWPLTAQGRALRLLLRLAAGTGLVATNRRFGRQKPLPYQGVLRKIKTAVVETLSENCDNRSC